MKATPKTKTSDILQYYEYSLYYEQMIFFFYKTWQKSPKYHINEVINIKYILKRNKQIKKRKTDCSLKDNKGQDFKKSE